MAAESLRHPATSGLSWRIARWTRVVPGRLGGAGLLLLPMLFFLPLGSFGFFDSWREGARVILSIGALVLGLAIGRDTSLPEATEFWVYQKGLSLADWGIGRWMLDAGLAVAVVVYWLILWTIAANLVGEDISFRVVAAGAVWLLSVYLITTSLLFALGATGSDRGAELCVMLLLLGLVEPVLTRLAPSIVGSVARVLLPPILPASGASGLLSSGEGLKHVLPKFLHVGAFVTVLLAAGAMLLARRRPEDHA